MTTNSRIPPLLSPYIVSPPKDSLLLLTSTLGTSANWILTRYLCSLLAGDAAKSRRSAPTPQEYAELSEAKLQLSATSGLNSGENEEYAVVLASWARDWDFWKVEGRRAAGLDIAQLSQNKRLAFVDGLTGLYSVRPTATNTQPSPIREAPPPSTTIPGRRPIPLRHAPGSPTVPAPAGGAPVSSAIPAQASQTTPYNTFKLTSTEFSHTRAVIEDAIASLTSTTSARTPAPKIILILDAPDVLLSLQAPGTTSTMTLQSLVFTLRSSPSIHSTIMSLSSDMNAPPSDLPSGHIPSLLEINTQAFLVGMAHEADLVIGCRGLDSGGAGDVSGVIRITKSTGDEEGEIRDWKEQELLYFVKGDGDVKVWERGAGVG